ncbi:MerR family transcriptional regulator [Microcella daejeonensis]|uniref:MerR family transcriptional regulator n=1 Tax=Microcella daejeonensis TaxID=2994971 RepID=UPI002271BF3F|nr:MerR family transcriptional regulator [Microcella daejeonensis]WAB83907.1 MerR family transcriptional regulator [Microcella daejeonensis]
MRMSELSTATGVAVPTLKFYRREGLLHAGETTSPNQARYDESHVARVRLVRAMVEIAGLSTASAQRVIAALDDGGIPLNSLFGVAQRAVTMPAALAHPEPAAADGDGAAEPEAADGPGARIIAELCARRGWHVHAGNPGLPMAARVLDAYAQLGRDDLLATVDAYADAADTVARADLAAVSGAGSVTAMTDVVVIGTVLGDGLLAGLRRIAQESESQRRFSAPPASLAADPEESC